MLNPLVSLPAVVAGRPEGLASVAVILLHGRTETAGHMVAISERIGLADAAYFALSAPDNSWYPERFLAPHEANQPHLDWAIGRVDRQVEDLVDRGWRRENIVVMGYSQGACLACEYVYRRPSRWGGLVAFTGGLLGPPGTSWSPHLQLAKTPVLITNGDNDPWVPWGRVEETGAVFQASGAEVEVQCYPGREHLVLDQEIAAARQLLARAVQPVAGA